MEDVMVASSEADSRAVEAVTTRCWQARCPPRVERLLSAGEVWQPIRDRLVAWCRSDLVPHAQAEERTIYPAAASVDRARLLLDAMVAEHGLISGLVEDLTEATDGVRAAGTAAALRTLAPHTLRDPPLQGERPASPVAGAGAERGSR